MNIFPYFVSDDWLSSTLNYPCFLTKWDANPDKAQIEMPNQGFITAKISRECVDLQEQIICMGFESVNVQQSFKLCEKNYNTIPLQKPSSLNFRFKKELAYPEDFSFLFNKDRFSVDKRLPRCWSEKIKIAWLRNFKNHRRFIVAIKDSREIGFILFDLGSNVEIQLVAVLPEYQGKGISKALMVELVGFVKGQNYPSIKVGTQKDNIYANKLYETLGFEKSNSYNVFHYFI